MPAVRGWLWVTLTLPSSPVHCPTEHAPSPTVHPSLPHFREEEPKAQRRVHLTQVTQPLSDMTGVWPRACVLPKTAYVCWKVPKLRLCGSSAGCRHSQAPAVRLNPGFPIYARSLPCCLPWCLEFAFPSSHGQFCELGMPYLLAGRRWEWLSCN